jgi:hypothetical protein
MASGKNNKSIWNEREAHERLQKYRRKINDSLKKYSGQKEKFVASMAAFILSEVRNERKTMDELGDDIKELFEKFKV